MTSNQTAADDDAPETSPEADESDPPTGGEGTAPAEGDDVTDASAGPADDEEEEAPSRPGADDEGSDDLSTDDGSDDDGSTDDGSDDDGSTDDGSDDDGSDQPLGDEDDEDDEDEGPSRVVLLVGAAVAFVAIAIVGVLIASGGGDSGGGGGDDTAEPTDARTDVGIFGSIDQFDRPDSTTTLGDFAPGRPWSPAAGTWGIDDGEAYLVESGEFRNHAVVGLGQGDGGVQVRLDTVVNGAGLVFRYLGPYSYWAVVAVPDVATWNIIKVDGGVQEVMGNTGQSPTSDGTTVAVRMRGDTIDVIVNGRVRKTVVDGFQADAGKVGITARGADSGEARFDDFVAGLPGGVPITSGRPGNEATGAGGSSTTTSVP